MVNPMGQISSETVAVIVTGLLTVFGVLALIAGVVAGFRRLDDHWQRQERMSVERALEKEQNIDNITLVLISAAAATVVAGRFRVRRIRRLLSPHAKRTPWSAQGRLILQGSHTVRRSNPKK